MFRHLAFVPTASLLLWACGGSMSAAGPVRDAGPRDAAERVGSDASPDAAQAHITGPEQCFGVSDGACAALREMALPAAIPAARGNAHADDLNAVLLGFHVFFDSRFSRGAKVRCQSCHSVDYSFADAQPTPVEGLGKGRRNSPTIFNAARYDTVFWDGRADSLWSQPLFAFENADEMDFTRLEVAHALAQLYDAEYAAAFGPLPDISDLKRFPARAAPGDAAYGGMTTEDKRTIDRIIANLGKALEAYMRKLVTGPSAFDRYLGGEVTALSESARRGVQVFVQAGCHECHSGVTLSDQKFHVLGIADLDPANPDEGQTAGAAVLASNPFNLAGAFADGAPEAPTTHQEPVLGGFRTPSLRNVALTAPYGHNGSFATLEEIVDFHLRGGGRGQQSFVGQVDDKLVAQELSDEDRQALVEFLKALNGKYPALPWSQWPSGNG